MKEAGLRFTTLILLVLVACSPRPTPLPTSTPEQVCSNPVCPTLLWLEPALAYPGSEVYVRAGGGDKKLPKSYSEDFPEFEMFLDDGGSIGTITCSSKLCSGEFKVPEDIVIGIHYISVEGGSTIELNVYQPGPSSPPPSDWSEVRIAGPASHPGFSLHLPPGWEFRDLRSFGSYVGEVAGDDMRIVFDSSAFVNPDDPDYVEYIVTWEPINGHQAMLLRPMEGRKGLTGVCFPSIHGPSLAFYTQQTLSVQQQETVFAIFRSIRSMGEQFRLNITFEPEGPLLNWGTPAPYIAVDRVEGDERLLAIRRDVKTKPVEGGGIRPLQTSQYDRWLTPGTYYVDIDHLGEYVSDDVPCTVVLETGKTTEVDIRMYRGER